MDLDSMPHLDMFLSINEVECVVHGLLLFLSCCWVLVVRIQMKIKCATI